jgi:hypothetical protein
VVGLLIAGGFALAAVNLFPHLRNPFATQVTDRTGPVLLQSIEDLNQFVAARGNFQVVVDYKEDRPYVPDFISSYHVLFVGQGSVDAYVDFTSLSEGAIQISGDGAEVTVTLPDPVLSDVHMDVNQSRVYSLDEGIFDKVKGLVADDYNRQGQLYQLASEKIKTAAIESELIDRARGEHPDQARRDPAQHGLRASDHQLHACSAIILTYETIGPRRAKCRGSMLI